jgi:hypothetical protein
MMDNLMKLKEIRGHRSKAACLGDAVQVSLCETAMAAHRYKAVLEEVRFCIEAITDPKDTYVRHQYRRSSGEVEEFHGLEKCLTIIKEL